MKKQTRYLWLSVILLLAIGCSSQAATETPLPEPTAEPEGLGEQALELIGPAGTVSLTMAELQALPAAQGWAGSKSSTGRITPPEPHTGVTLMTLAEQIGGLEPGQGLQVVAKDGYAITFSHDQIANGTFITYDPGTGDELSVDDPLQAIVAYKRSDAPLSPEADGPLRIAVLSPENNQVVDGHWTVKWVEQIAIKDMAEDWTLELTGALSEEMDRATFESCAATNCHGASWTDADGQTWNGVPLWLMAGRIDGGEKHGDDAYNAALAQQGYSLQVIAADGYSVPFDSTRFDGNEAMLLAHLIDGELLPEKHFPLRLVGAELEKSEMVGQVAQLKADLPAEAAATAQTVAPPPEPWTLQLDGAVSEAVDWAAFHSCAGCHPASWTDADGQVWSGVPLWLLLGRVDDGNRHDADAYNQALAEAGYTLEVIAADGYSVALESGRVDRQDQLLVAYRVNDEWLAEKHYPLRLVGEGLEKNEMVGQVAQILLDVPAKAAAGPDEEGEEAATGDVALTVTGAVEVAQEFSLAALREMEMVEAEVEHPKKGRQTYTGIPLNELLALAGVDAEASALVMRAGDGYQTQTGLEEVRACTDCLISITDENTLYLVMPGMEGGLWVKDVIQLELK